jgi:hypothetical protein
LYPKFALLPPEYCQLIKIIETDSRSLSIQDTFDFIIIDGDHTYEGALNDVHKCLPLLHDKSILCLDDYQHFPEVARVVNACLLGQNDFIPFLCTEQQMLFHHVTHSADAFLDKCLIEKAVEFIDFANLDWKGFTVLQAKICISAIAKDPTIFRSVLQFYDL